MELLLNGIWLALVAASAVKLALWSRDPGARRVPTVAIATICILALLFPIISITDDLHLKKAVVEEARSIATVPVTIVWTFALVVVGLAHVALAAVPASDYASASGERGPPAV